MNRLLYSAALIASVILISCKHKQAVASSTVASSNSTSTQTNTSTTTTTTTVTSGETGTTTTVGAGEGGNTTTTVAATDSSNLYRVTISFISKGEGIDYKTLESTEAWIKAQSKTPAYTKTHWGREGETNLCLKLNELSTREQEIFVRDLRTQLTDKALVMIAEYAECKGRPE